MALAEMSYVFQGPPQASQITDDPNSESQSDEESGQDFEEDTDMIVLCINESSLANSPQVLINTHQCQLTAILQSGSEVNLLSERVYEKLIERFTSPYLTCRGSSSSNGVWLAI
jgi:hypothetical protein